MTHKAALDVLKEAAVRLQGNEILYRAICVAIPVVEKQIPKKPRGDYHSCPHYRCPNCHSSVKLYEHDNKYPHCGYCGQAIDWSDANG